MKKFIAIHFAPFIPALSKNCVRRTTSAFVALLTFSIFTTVSAALPDPIAKSLRAQGIAAGSVSMIALPLNGEAPLIAHQVDLPLNPASVMKLVTTWSALNILGPDYRWRSTAHLQGNLVDGVLSGDLALKGAGDPKIVIEDLLEWLGAMRRSGLREIKGDLIIDESLFENIGASMEAFDGDPGQPYNVRPHPMMLNFKSTKFTISPAGDTSTIALDPPLADVRVENQIRVVAGPCKHGASGLTISDGSAPMQVIVSGTYSASCAEQSTYAAILDHRSFIFALFKAAWQSLGGSISGTVKTGVASSREWSEWRSPRTLADITKDINKFSNNVMTRTLLLQMGLAAKKNSTQKTASVERGRNAVLTMLKSQGIELPQLVLDNGSGLSRLERVSALGLAKILITAADSPLADIYRNSLPIVGVDGTMSRRLLNTGVVGNAWIKTGSINQVAAIAGYVQAKSGKRYAIALLANGAGANATRVAQDQFLLWVFENG